mmetsp:Transcript_7792/g.11266  ORF Transcript_7792/g.11266 Transcript_7792/m.11266 type:complete len:215 (-) Transcript_7792:358-1002(-)
MNLSVACTRIGTRQRKRPTPSMSPSTRPMEERILMPSLTELPSSAPSSVSSPTHKLRNSTSASRRLTLWKSKSTEEPTLKPRSTLPKISSRRRSLLILSSQRTNKSMLLESPKVRDSRVSLPVGVSPVSHVRPTVVSVRLPVLDRGTLLVCLPQSHVPVKMVTSTVPNSTRRCTESERRETRLLAKPLPILPRRASPQWEVSSIMVKSMRIGSC